MKSFDLSDLFYQHEIDKMRKFISEEGTENYSFVFSSIHGEEFVKVVDLDTGKELEL